MLPSINQISIAIVAACRETGENPPAIDGADPMRARHYAMHAMHRVFPDAPRTYLAKCVGCKGDPKKFFFNSVNQKFKVRDPVTGARMAAWWDDAAFERVIQRLRATVTPGPPAEPVETVIRAAPVKLSAHTGGIVEPQLPSATPGKNKLRDMLAEAFRNTAKLPLPRD